MSVALRSKIKTKQQQNKNKKPQCLGGLVVAQGVKDSASLLLWHRLKLWLGFDSWPRNFHIPWVRPKKKKKKKNRTEQNKPLCLSSGRAAFSLRWALHSEAASLSSASILGDLWHSLHRGNRRSTVMGDMWPSGRLSLLWFFFLPSPSSFYTIWCQHLKSRFLASLDKSHLATLGSPFV